MLNSRNASNRRESPCEVAAEFERKIRHTIFQPMSQVQSGGTVSRAQVAQAKYFLQEEYQAFKKALSHSGSQMLFNRHKCVQEIYDEAYRELHLLDLSIRPAINLILDYERLAQSQAGPQTPSQPLIHKIPGGIFFGEHVLGDDENPA